MEEDIILQDNKMKVKWNLISVGEMYGEDYKRYQAKSDIFYGDVDVSISKAKENIEVTGASFKFETLKDLQNFISRLEDAERFFPTVEE